jgi:hypothetical protein
VWRDGQISSASRLRGSSEMKRGGLALVAKHPPGSVPAVQISPRRGMDGDERAGASRGAVEVLSCGAFFQCPPHELAERSVCTRGALALFTSCGASDVPAYRYLPGGG